MNKIKTILVQLFNEFKTIKQNVEKTQRFLFRNLQG